MDVTTSPAQGCERKCRAQAGWVPGVQIGHRGKGVHITLRTPVLLHLIASYLGWALATHGIGLIRSREEGMEAWRSCCQTS
eukprot:scaffold38343_cov26-Tisochrysis_lutea.AAC.7